MSSRSAELWSTQRFFNRIAEVAFSTRNALLVSTIDRLVTNILKALTNEDLFPFNELLVLVIAYRDTGFSDRHLLDQIHDRGNEVWKQYRDGDQAIEVNDKLGIVLYGKFHHTAPDGDLNLMAYYDFIDDALDYPNAVDAFIKERPSIEPELQRLSDENQDVRKALQSATAI